MKKTKFLIIVIFILCYKIITMSSEIKLSIIDIFDLWKNSLFPYLFPFFVISDILISLNFIELINKYLNKFIYKLFKINSSSSFVFLMSIISGIPSNAKYINTLLNEKKMNEYEANKIILFTHFCNPLFILGIIGSKLNDNNLALLILLTHYITNIVLGLLFRNYHPNKLDNLSDKKRTNNLLKTITNSFINSINTLLLILGVIAFFSIISTIINSYIDNNVIKSIISGILEITQGINNICNLNISPKYKAIIISFIISFGGFSSHLQVMSILENHSIIYIPYFLSRILHAIISCILIFIMML